MEPWMDNEISFPSVPGCQLVNSPIILEALIEGFQVRRIYVDGGSSSEVMYEHCFRYLGTEIKAKLRESRVPLVGLSGEFVVVKCHSPYNVILGRTGMRSLGAMASTIHSMIKFPTANGITTMVTKKETLQECRRMEEAHGHALENIMTHPRMKASEPNDSSIKKRRETQEEQRLEAGQPDVTTSRPSPLERKATLNEKKKDNNKMNTLFCCRTRVKNISSSRAKGPTEEEHSFRQKEGGKERGGGMD
ncbi:hypothetical protein Tco_0710728 [Tanacetum coccineum]